MTPGAPQVIYVGNYTVKYYWSQQLQSGIRVQDGGRTAQFENTHLACFARGKSIKTCQPKARFSCCLAQVGFLLLLTIKKTKKLNLTIPLAILTQLLTLFIVPPEDS